MLRCLKCHGQVMETISTGPTPPHRRLCQGCGFSGPDGAFHASKTGPLSRSEKQLRHSARWSHRHMRRPPVLNKMEELMVGLASLLLGALSGVVFPFPVAVPALVWALTISAFIFLVLFVAAHIWKAHAKGTSEGTFNSSYDKASTGATKTIRAAGTPKKNGKKKRTRR